ncbi:MAG TPA: hypothetical protein VFN67_43155, partial [Polyangiales bacterium]|nr:hypothetical protein [Polyangiales bacterium]
MQERSRGSKGFELGDLPADSQRGVVQPTRASIYQEDHTPAHWPPPTDANARAMQGKPRAPRNGLIASQLGLPMQTRAPAQPQHYPPDSWQTLAAADGDWPLDDRSQQPAAAYTEDAELQAALDLDNSQGLYDEQLGAYYSAATPQLDLRLPPVAAHHGQGYAWSDDEVETSHYARSGHHNMTPQPATTGKYPFAQVARQTSQPSAAKWQVQQPIQRVGAPNASRTPGQPARAAQRANPYVPAANAQVARAGQPQSNAPRQPARPANRQAGNANTQARSVPKQLIHTANAPVNRTAKPQARNASAHLNRSANTQAQYAPAHLNRTATGQAHNAPAHLNRSANTQAQYAPAHLNRTATGQA